MDTSSDHNSKSRSGETSYWVRRDNKIKGPRRRQRVITAINDRRLSPTDEISLTENGPWFPLEKWMNQDCNDEVLKILEGPTITEHSSELEVLEIADSVSSESKQKITGEEWFAFIMLLLCAPLFFLAPIGMAYTELSQSNFWVFSTLSFFLCRFDSYSL